MTPTQPAARAHAVFYVDCTPRSGLGHLSRCRNLARQLATHGVAASFRLTSDLGLDRTQPWPGHVLVDNDVGAAVDLAVIDGYGFDDGQVSRWTAAARASLVFDDHGVRPCRATIVLNGNLDGDPVAYGRYDAAHLLVGPAFALVPEGLAAARLVPLSRRRRILVTFGGTDDGALGGAVAGHLAALGRGEIDLVLSHPNPRVPVIPGVTVHRYCDLVPLMSAAWLYVGGGGVTLLEALAAGMAVVGVQIAENQSGQLAAARRLGLATFDNADLAEITRVAENLNPQTWKAPAQPDGQGGTRVMKTLLDCLGLTVGNPTAMGNRGV